MSGINWGHITCGNKLYDMTHLHKKTVILDITGRELTLNFTFGFHVFTDEKGLGRSISHRGEERYFCINRYNESFTLVERILKAISDDYVTSFVSKSKRRRYYHINQMDDFILMEIRAPQGKINTLNLNVVTAYTIDTWSDKSKLVKGKNLRFSYVLEMRMNGKHNI